MTVDDRELGRLAASLADIAARLQKAARADAQADVQADAPLGTVARVNPALILLGTAALTFAVLVAAEHLHLGRALRHLF